MENNIKKVKKKTNPNLVFLEVVLLIVGLLFIYPITLIYLNSVKPFKEIVVDVIALPKELTLDNFKHVFAATDFPRLFMNNILITVISLVGIIFFSSLGAYVLERSKSKLSKVIFNFCILPMLVPFQTIMITLVKLMNSLGLANSIIGLSIQYWGFCTPMALFIYYSFVKTIPKELDESAMMDGSSTFRTFREIIFPILKPTTATITILDVMMIWNDFLLPLLMVNSRPETKTLTLAAYSFVGQYSTNWNYAMAAMVLAVSPSIIFFLLMQKHIIKGVVDGAVKG